MRRILAAVMAAALFVPAAPTAAHALMGLPGLLPRPVPALPKTSLELMKPPVESHPDTVPPFADGGGVLTPAPTTGTIDPLEASPPDPAALAAEDAAYMRETRLPDPSSSIGPNQMPTANLDGRNNITFASFWDGDIVVVKDPYFSAGHCGIFDKSFYTGDGSYALIAANTAPRNGVQREQGYRYRNYDRAYGLWVPIQAHHRTAARQFATRQIGKPYGVSISKGDTRTFYCSKLAWCSWYYTAGVDLDANGGWFVWPMDIVNSPLTSMFGYWN